MGGWDVGEPYCRRIRHVEGTSAPVFPPMPVVTGKMSRPFHNGNLLARLRSPGPWPSQAEMLLRRDKLGACVQALRPGTKKYAELQTGALRCDSCHLTTRFAAHIFITELPLPGGCFSARDRFRLHRTMCPARLPLGLGCYPKG